MEWNFLFAIIKLYRTFCGFNQKVISNLFRNKSSFCLFLNIGMFMALFVAYPSSLVASAALNYSAYATAKIVNILDGVFSTYHPDWTAPTTLKSFFIILANK